MVIQQCYKVHSTSCSRKNFGSMSGGFIPSDLSFTLTGKRSADELSNCKPKSLFHPTAFVEDSSDSYPDVPGKTECRRHRSARYRHDVTCARHPSRRQVTRSASNAHMNSMASLHSSSGKDSGIADNSPHRCCPCSQSSNSSKWVSHTKLALYSYRQVVKWFVLNSKPRGRLFEFIARSDLGSCDKLTNG